MDLSLIQGSIIIQKFLDVRNIKKFHALFLGIGKKKLPIKRTTYKRGKKLPTCKTKNAASLGSLSFRFDCIRINTTIEQITQYLTANIKNLTQHFLLPLGNPYKQTKVTIDLGTKFSKKMEFHKGESERKLSTHQVGSY